MAENSELREWPQTRVEWRIKNFWDLSTEVGFYMESPRFFLSDTEWYISIYPNGESEQNHDSVGWIGLYLCREETHKEHYVDINLVIKKYDGTVLENDDGSDDAKLTAAQYDDAFLFENIIYARGCVKFIKRSTLRVSNAVSSDGTLTVFCSAAIVDGASKPTTKEAESQTTSLSTIETKEVASQTLCSDSKLTLVKNFKDLYLSKRLADVTITVNGRDFFTHKNVLISRSMVFASMFTSDMAVKNNGKVEITDCDPDTFGEFLLFLYTGELDMVIPSNAPSLYRTADKYDVQELKAECVRCMINELTIDSICDVVRLATMHEEPEILQAAIKFFIENAEKILVTVKWMNFTIENPSLGNELFIKFVHNHKSMMSNMCLK